MSGSMVELVKPFSAPWVDYGDDLRTFGIVDNSELRYFSTSKGFLHLNFEDEVICSGYIKHIKTVWS